MSVLVEGVSVIVRKDAILSEHPVGPKYFYREVPNPHTLRADEHLAAVTVESLQAASAYIDYLVLQGFTHLVKGWPRDITVVDQITGPLNKASWLEEIYFYKDRDPAKRVTACRLAGTGSDTLFVPNDWTFEGSLSQLALIIQSEGRWQYQNLDSEDEIGSAQGVH